MINGRILITTITIDQWVQEAIETDVEHKASQDEAQDVTDWHLPRTTQIGWGRIESRLHDHCEAWSFGANDRKLIEGIVRPIYEEARKFLDL
jgi:hypothetical protein